MWLVLLQYNTKLEARKAPLSLILCRGLPARMVVPVQIVVVNLLSSPRQRRVVVVASAQTLWLRTYRTWKRDVRMLKRKHSDSNSPIADEVRVGTGCRSLTTQSASNVEDLAAYRLAV